MTHFEKALENYVLACKTVQEVLDEESELLDALYSYCENAKDDEIIPVKAEVLKVLFSTAFGMLSCMNQDMEQIQDYLSRKHFI